jgi:hypothetical protein
LICNLSRQKVNSHRGFALPIALMVGLVILVVGATMIIRAQSDQSNVISQKAKTVANAAAETGMTRLQNTILQYPAIAQYSMEEWQNVVTAYTANANTTDATLTGLVATVRTQSCDAKSKTDAQVKSDLVLAMSTMAASTDQTLPNPDSSNSNFAPYYKLVKYYYYPDGTAKFHLLGKAGSNGNARSNLVATVPVAGDKITNPTVAAFPGLWVKQYLRAGQNDNNPGTLEAHVAYDCGINAGTFTTSAGNGSASGYTKYVSSGTSGGGTAIRVALPTGDPAPEVTLMPMPDPPSSASGVTPASLGSITGSLTLPRSGTDTTSSSNYKSSNQTYYYTASSISGNGVNLQFTAGQKVVIFLTGNISIGGSSQITHNCGNVSGCDATDVHILGSTSSANGLFSTGGNSAVCSIFFWAPTYTVDMNGGGNAGDCPSGANQNGIYWVKAWQGGGQGSHEALVESGSGWDKVKSVVTLPVKNKLGSTTQWGMVDDTYAVTPPTAAQLVAIAAIRAGTTTTTSQNSTTCTVPSLTNITLTDAASLNLVTSAIANAGLTAGTATVSTSGSDGVQSQTLTAGSSVTCGTTTLGYTYKLPTNPTCLVPNIVGTKGNKIPATWNTKGGNVTTTVANNGSVSAASQSPAALSNVACTTTVTVN